jgi:8-oxo-dGTP pyrophosphatase MutT (NUDIX family)
MSDLDTAVIEGAGGIVERDAADGTRIAVVRRKRYGGEWGLPKGKRKPGESWQETALREVEEEIGLRAMIIGIAGSSLYLAASLPKLVIYWRMRVDSNVPPFTPNDEVAVLEWLLPEAAIERLTHAQEAEVVRKAFPQSSSRRPNPNIARWAGWLDRQIVPILRRRPLKRLAIEISVYKEELQGRVKCNRSIDIVKAAERAVASGDIDGGWQYLQAARRLELAASKDPAEINTAAIALREEADHKLSGWRKTAVNALLTVASGATLDTQKVREAAQIRDGYFSNQAYKDGLRRATNCD